jgi:hypothetical protein
MELPCTLRAFATPFGSEANYTTFASLDVNAEKHSDLNQVCSLYFHIEVFLLLQPFTM